MFLETSRAGVGREGLGNEGGVKKKSVAVIFEPPCISQFPPKFFCIVFATTNITTTTTSYT
jgi:hypothetical protein